MVRVILTVVILTLLGTVVLAAPVIKVEDAQLKVISESNNYKTDNFDWSYELSDGRIVRQSAYSKPLEDGSEVLVVNGFYSYVAPDGVKYAVSYYADENGYHPTVIVNDQLIAPQFPQGAQFSVTGQQVYNAPVPLPQPIDPNVLKSLVGGSG